MKLLRYLFFSLLLTSAAFAQASTIAFSWTSDGNPGVPTCSATVTVSCLTTYTLSDVTNASSPVVLTSSLTPSTLAYSYALPPLTAAGSRIYNLVINGLSSTGTAVVSSPASVTVAVPAVGLSAPAGFTGTP